MKLKFQDEIVKTIKLKQQNHSIEIKSTRRKGKEREGRLGERANYNAT
jgi:hypothetical protein